MPELELQTDFIETRREGKKHVIILKGEWTVRTAAAIENIIAESLHKTGKGFLKIHEVKISKLDTAGALLVKRHFGDHYLPEVFTERQMALLDFLPHSPKALPRKQKETGLAAFFIRIGKTSYSVLEFLYKIFSFIGVIFDRLFTNIFHPRHFRLPSIVRHIHETGIQALPIIGLMALGISMVVSYQGAVQLRKFGADIYTIDLTVISLLREMGVLATTIMVVGRSGSAFAAEIGVMKLRGEIDALKTMGMDPIETLVLPRLLALLITLPLLTFFADIVGLAGGGLMSSTQLDVSMMQYIHRVQEVATPTMFFVGMIKAPVFAFLIAVICTYQGMNVSGSAENVGKLTTLAVVQSIFIVIMMDAIFSIIFSKLEI